LAVLASRFLDELKEQGVDVLVLQGDVSKEADLRRVFEQMNKQGLPPLRGVFHLAMVLDDVPINQLDWLRIRKVLEPKIGYPLGGTAARDGLRVWHDLFELSQSLAAGRRVVAVAPNPLGRTPRSRLHRLVAGRGG
jgi:hypothetical protein